MCISVLTWCHLVLTLTPHSYPWLGCDVFLRLMACTCHLSLPLHVPVICMNRPCAPMPPVTPPHSFPRNPTHTLVWVFATLCCSSIRWHTPCHFYVWTVLVHLSTYLASSFLLIILLACFYKSLLPCAAPQFSGSLPAIYMNHPFPISPFLRTVPPSQ